MCQLPWQQEQYKYITNIPILFIHCTMLLHLSSRMFYCSCCTSGSKHLQAVAHEMRVERFCSQSDNTWFWSQGRSTVFNNSLCSHIVYIYFTFSLLCSSGKDWVFTWQNVWDSFSQSFSVTVQPIYNVLCNLCFRKVLNSFSWQYTFLYPLWIHFATCQD